MSSSACDLCDAPKAQRNCEECGRAVCKNCLEFLPADRMPLHPAPPPFASKAAFCADCFAEKVRPELDRYDEVYARSRELVIVRSSYRGFIPYLRKAPALTEIEGEIGRGQAELKLRFLAAWQDYDSIVEFETESRKVRNHGWEKKAWSARGLFACIDHERFRPPEEST